MTEVTIDACVKDCKLISLWHAKQRASMSWYDLYVAADKAYQEQLQKCSCTPMEIQPTKSIITKAVKQYVSDNSDVKVVGV